MYKPISGSITGLGAYQHYLYAHYSDLAQKYKNLLLQFLEGLHSLVPDSLLALFDENELELLICGVRDYKLSELKRNHDVVANGLSGRTISWFWLALDHFTQGDESCCYLNYVCSTGR